MSAMDEATTQNCCSITVLVHNSLCGCSGPVGRVSDILTERLWVRLTPGPLQATLSKLLTYVWPGQLSLLPSAGREMSSSYGYGVKA